MASNTDRNRPVVSSLAMTFKKKAGITDDIEEVKREHRVNLKRLINDYMENVDNGRAQGIRTAKELVEVIKADLLLMGEATDRTESTNSVDEVRVQQINNMLDEDNPHIQALIGDLFESMNLTNDNFGSMAMGRHPQQSQPKTEDLSEDDTEEE